MKDEERIRLENLTLAPYLQKATALIGRRRMVGGNQFRHAMATLAILIDYHFTDPVLLKASVIHDLFEDVRDTDRAEIAAIDEDGEEVVNLALEVTRTEESKDEYLERIGLHGSPRAKVLKVADRISNLTDLHTDTFSKKEIQSYLDETRKFIVPIAFEVSEHMAQEISDLLNSRQEALNE
jgi:GTP pyrophosphokinase